MMLFDPALAPFTIALMVMGLIAALELVSMLFGAPLSGVVDNLFPEAPEIDVGPGLGAPGMLDSFFGWLGFGRAPVMILLAALLASFGIIGLLAQSMWHGAFGFYLPAILPALVAAPLALFPTRWVGKVFQRLFPKEESDAVSSDSFIGKVAIILRGEASQGRPAEAKLRDLRGTTHYLLVEPDDGDARFAAGSEVLIVSRAGVVFKAIINPSAVLTAS